ncbi:MAG: hypothetical protein HZA20_10340 [Nitrospirae bacterium]|nr:hypothetical protein [Nitrospirota bacterium]
MRAITVICISVLILPLMGCPPQPFTHPGMYEAAGITDSGGNPHFIIGHDFKDVVMHFWKDGETLHKVSVQSFPGHVVKTVTYGKDGICAYTAGQFKGCTTDNTNWKVYELQNTVPSEYTGGCWGYSSWYDEDRLDDGRYILSCMHLGESASKIYEFFIIDDINGVVNEYLTPLDLTRILYRNAPPFDLKREPWLLQASFRDDGAWDAKSYIFGVVFESSNTYSARINFFHVSFKDVDWTIEKIGELDLAYIPGINSLINGTFKGNMVTMAAQRAVVKRDKNSGHIILEPLEGKYAAMYEAANSVAIGGRN